MADDLQDTPQDTPQDPSHRSSISHGSVLQRGRLSLSINWIVGIWVIVLISVSALLTALALSARTRERNERACIQTLKLLVRKPVQSADDLIEREALIRATLKLRLTLIESAWYLSPLVPSGLPLSSAPLPQSFQRGRGRVLELVSSVSSGSARYELSMVGLLQDQTRRPRLVMRLGALPIKSVIMSALRERWAVLSAQMLILLLFALYLSYTWIISPLHGVVALAYRLTRTPLERDSTDSSALDIVKDHRLRPNTLREVSALEEALLELTRALRHEQAVLASAYQALQERERLITAGYVSARVMHELGNPLASVSGLVEFLCDEPELKEEHRALLKLAFEELKRARDTARVIREVTRAPMQHAESSNTTTRDVTDWLTLMLRYHERFSTLELIITEDQALAPKLPIDLDALRYALLNITLNAAQAQEGQGALWLDLSMMSSGVQLTLSDLGPGLDPDWLTAHFSGHHEGGGGLGLLIARDAIESRGGRLWMLAPHEHPAHESEPELSARFTGARFAIWVPCSAEVE